MWYQIGEPNINIKVIVEGVKVKVSRDLCPICVLVIIEESSNSTHTIADTLTVVNGIIQNSNVS